jgi:methionyl-tRNA formyltransferase
VRIVFFGSPPFAVPSLRQVAAAHEVILVVSQPDRPSGRGQALTPPPVKVAALELGLPVEQPAKLKDPAVAERLATLGPDVFVVVAYGRILPPALLAVPRLGPWNVHASLLPELRGAAPIQWAIIRGAQRTGACIMRMEEGLDTGPVAACAEEPIRDDDTAGTLSERLASLGSRLLASTLPRIEAGTVSLVPQDHVRATLAPMLTKEDGRLDFRQPARAVSAHARGVDPWPGATARLAGDSIRLFAPRLLSRQGAPGEVLGLVDEGLAVACGQDAVAFGELQLPGRKRLPAAAVLAGRDIPPGTRLEGKV